MSLQRSAAPDGPVPPGTHSLVRTTLIALAAAAVLAVLALLGVALAAARVPQDRATLESLVRAETGLDVRFSELGLRWGWYGPEAVFHDVELREPGDPRLFLTAPQLVAGADLWRMLRTGQLAIGRITLVNPDIDLTQPLPAGTARGTRAAAPPEPDPAHLLAGWRGTRIDVEGGTLRAAAAGVPFAAGIRRVQLRRFGSAWSAEAWLSLAQSLGATVHAVARLTAASDSDLSGSVTLSGSRLDFAGWRALLGAAPGAGYLPTSGSGEATAQLELTHGGLARAQGSVEAAGLSWPAAGATAADFSLERLQASWQLVRAGAGWRLAFEPNQALQVRAAGLTIAARVRGATVDWSGADPPAERLRTSAELEELSIAAPGGSHRLVNLSARLTGVGGQLVAELHSSDARLTLADDPDFDAGALGLNARVQLQDDGRTWRLSTHDLQLRAGDARFTATATITGADGGAHPRIDAQATLSAVPVELLRRAIGATAFETLGAVAGGLTAGRIEHADLVARGPLDETLPWSGARQEFRGSLELAGATLAGRGDWPDLDGLDAHVDWRGARLRVRVSAAGAGDLRLAAAQGEWDARDGALTRLNGRLEGPAEQALAWLREHPQLLADAPGIGELGLAGRTLVDFDLRRVVARGRTPVRYSTRLTALLDGARLNPVAGLPVIEALRGTLAFRDGHLQRSTVTGQWLGGPVALGVAERREHGAAVLAISGRGLLDVRETLAATGADGDATSALEGKAAWSAELRSVPGTDGAGGSWRARADSNLIGVASRLPEPFAKEAGSALPLHLELLGNQAAGELRMALGERLRGVAAVRRRADLWQIERGALNFDASAPTLPAVPQLKVAGSIERLDLPAWVALWRELSHEPAWPALSVELAAAEVRAGDLSFPDVRIVADTGAGVDQLSLQSSDLQARLRVPEVMDADHPVIARLEHLDLARFESRGLALAGPAALWPAVQLSIGDVAWQGRSLGTLTATLRARARELEVRDLHLSGAGDEARGTLDCGADVCRGNFSLESHDAAATLTRLGLRPDIQAAHAVMSAEVTWPARTGPDLASAGGRIHIEIDDGLTRGAPAGEASQGTPPGLLAVTGLVAGMGLAELPFAHLSADLALEAGQAVTRNLHLDGDTEILMQGRVGLLARDYDAQVWVLKGEERLPAAVRALRPGPRIAALWMSLRDLLGAGERERAALRLHGTWDDPMVTQP